MIKGLINKIGLGLTAGALAVLGLANYAHAAADADLVAGMASTTAIFTDNKGAIITGIVGVFTAVIVLMLVFKLLQFAKRQMAGLFGGGRRKK
jgi:hypothetical protein